MDDALEQSKQQAQVSVPSHHDIVHVGDRPDAVNLLLAGFACRYVLLPDGKRQITSFHIPGDIPDLCSLLVATMDHSVRSLSSCRLLEVPHPAMLALEHPPIANLFWRETLIDAAVFREWMTGLGRRSAYARIAHFFCELITRMRAIELASDHQIDLPLTQTDIADALGLSAVHVNRTLQELRAAGLIELTRGRLATPRWQALRRAGEFEESYLHQRRLDSLVG